VHLLDASFAANPLIIHGFAITYSSAAGSPATHYKLHADPLEPGVSGIRSFYADQTGNVRFSYHGPANDQDTVLPD
jgi:hypothetical protein